MTDTTTNVTASKIFTINLTKVQGKRGGGIGPKTYQKDELGRFTDEATAKQVVKYLNDNLTVKEQEADAMYSYVTHPVIHNFEDWQASQVKPSASKDKLLREIAASTGGDAAKILAMFRANGLTVNDPASDDGLDMPELTPDELAEA